MIHEEDVYDLFQEKRFRKSILEMVEKGIINDLRPVIETEESVYYESNMEVPSLIMLLMAQYREIEKMAWFPESAIGFFGKKAFFDIIGLHFARGITDLRRTPERCINGLDDIIHKSIKRNDNLTPEEILSQFDKGEFEVESEEQLDLLLISMLSYKLNHNGVMKKEYCDFVIKQCFDKESLIMKNSEKYREVILRFLEDFARVDAIHEDQKTEVAIKKALSHLLTMLNNKDTLNKISQLNASNFEIQGENITSNPKTNYLTKDVDDKYKNKDPSSGLEFDNKIEQEIVDVFWRYREFSKNRLGF